MGTINDNIVTLAGFFGCEPEYSHDSYGEKFYKAHLECERLSGFVDNVPLLIPEKFIKEEESLKGKFVHICGQFRSYNQRNSDKNRLILYVYVNEMFSLCEGEETFDFENRITLNGYICKKSEERSTSKGINILDLILAVNRQCGRSDYIPLVFWGTNADYVSEMDIGTNIKIDGRIQSREYKKKIDENTAETRTAYEVSVSYFNT